MVADHRLGQMEKVRHALSLLALPLQYAVDLPIKTGEWVAESLATRRNLLAENSRYKEEHSILKAQLQKYAALESENLRLRELLGSSFKVGDQVQIAEILRVELNPLKRQILINKGSQDGAFIRQPIVDADGIVGQIIHVNKLTSQVILITDPDHAIPVQVLRNGLRTIAVGSKDEGLLNLPYVAANADIEIGDVLITSGLGGRFPYGYPVATISAIEKSNVRSFASVRAMPRAKLDRIREVLLVWDSEQPKNKTEQGVAQ